MDKTAEIYRSVVGVHLGTQTWTMGPRHGATTANAILHIDFAKANDIQGVLFEGWNEGWENWGGNQHFDYIKPMPTSTSTPSHVMQQPMA